MFVDLAADKFEFQVSIKNKDTGEETQRVGIETGRKKLGDFMDQMLNTEKRLHVSRREAMKWNKLLLYAITALILKEKTGGQLNYYIEAKKGVSKFSKSLFDNPEYNHVVDRVRHWFSTRNEFNPTASVIGSVASQEIIKVITRKDFPSNGLFLYDSDIQMIKIEKI